MGRELYGGLLHGFREDIVTPHKYTGSEKDIYQAVNMDEDIDGRMYTTNLRATYTRRNELMKLYCMSRS